VGDEGVVMLHLLKDSLDHFINKEARALIRRDPGREMPRDAKLDRLPRHGIPQAHGATGHSGNRALAGVRHRVAMEVNVER
jgi:hypothetical protein